MDNQLGTKSFRQSQTKNNFKIYNTKNHFYLQYIYSECLLEIEKGNSEYSIVFNNVFSDMLIIECIQAHCLIGIIKIFGYEYLLYSASSELVGKLFDQHEVFVIKQADAICLSYCKQEEIPKEVKTQISGICSLLSLGFFYSFTYDLSNNLQRQENTKSRIMKEMIANKNNINLYFDNDLNFNIDVNILSNINNEKLKVLVDDFYINNIQKYSRKKYYWNCKLNSKFDLLNKDYYQYYKINKKNKMKTSLDSVYSKNEMYSDIELINHNLKQSNNKKPLYLNNFIVVLICGYYAQQIVEKRLDYLKDENQKSLTIDIALLSRRSVNYSGTRYNRRGINKEGHVANFVETEQIVSVRNKFFSFVQLRGSAPVFFQQTGLNYKTSIISDANDPLSQEAFQKHTDECIEDHQYLMMINLLDSTKDKETDLIKVFEEQIQIASNASKMNNKKYVYFNFTQECKKDDFTQIEKQLLTNIEKIFKIFNFFCYNQITSSIECVQQGVFRTNCLDSLDRTNVVQTRLAYESLRLNLSNVGINLNELTSLNNFSNESFFCTFEENDNLMLAIKDLWGNNGDIISLQYAGTESCKTSITRSGKSELMEKIKVGVDRFIQSNFEDKFKQSCYDFLLQNGILNTNYSQYTLSDQVNEDESNSNYEKKYFSGKNTQNNNKITSNTKDYITCPTGRHILDIFTGSWNVAGIDVFKDSQLKLIDWLYPSKETKLNGVPDIYIVTFQEIVSLNATNILFKSNSTSVDGWKAVVQDALSVISKKYENDYNSTTDEFLLVKTLELVGILMFVFIKRKYFSEIKNIDYIIKKTGASGYLGNKGSVLYRFDIFNRSFAFSSGHFAAGQNALKNRIEELVDVLNSNINNNSSICTFKGRLQDHDFWFIIGDLNFRIDMDNEQVRALIKRGDFERLASYDQLNKIRLEDKDFYCIDEGKINFPPTYKYNIGTSEYETKKNRVPSWCDRIIYKKSEGIHLQSYCTLQDISFSDHKPIYALFKIDLHSKVDHKVMKQHSNTVSNHEIVKTSLSQNSLLNPFPNLSYNLDKDGKNKKMDNEQIKQFDNYFQQNLNMKDVKEVKKNNEDDEVELSLFKNIPEILIRGETVKKNSVSIKNEAFSNKMLIKPQNVMLKPATLNTNNDINQKKVGVLLDLESNEKDQTMEKRNTKDILSDIFNK